METIIFKAVYVLAVAATSVIRYPHEKRKKTNTIKTDNIGGLEKMLLASTLFGFMILPLLYIFTNLLSFADYTLPVALNILGVILVVVSLWLFYRSHKDLGLNWSPTLEIREGHNIVDNGVYKYIRHPMYTSLWLMVLAQPLLLNNYIAGLAGIASFGSLYFLRVKREEAMMKKEFGESYEEYMKKTKRVIPFVL